tara:strand:- start:7856 stop:8638 length:783 start_codon:yes stop_codon:yes gene_type:complete
MSKKAFSVDDTLYRAQAKRLVKQLKLDENVVVREQAGLLAQLLAKVTPPFKSFPKMSGKPSYTTGGALGKGNQAVKAGFNSIVKRMGTATKWKDKRIKAAIKAGDAAYLEKRLQHFKGSNKHGLKVRKYSNNLRNRQRNSKGRANKGTQPIVMLSNADVKKGQERAVKNVGIAKASFALAAIRLGRPSAPKWISRHFAKVKTPVRITSSPASVSFTSKAKGLDVTMRRLKSVERFRMVAMVKRLESLIKADAKKAGFKTK